MYQVTKPKGYSAVVTLTNTETSSSVNIGQPTTALYHLLEDADHAMAGKERDDWDFEVDKETAEALAKLTMRMKKPIRDQKKKPEETPEASTKVNTSGKDVDMFDLIFGSVD